MKSNSNSDVNLYWTRTGYNSFSFSRMNTREYTGNGAWQTLVFPVGNHPQWITSITKLRLDPTTVANASFEIDYMHRRFVNYSLLQLIRLIKERIRSLFS